MTTKTAHPAVKWILVSLVALILIALGVLGAAAVAAQQFKDSDLIAANVRIEGVPVGGMNSAEATRAVLDQWAAKLPEEVILTWDGGKRAFSPEQLGARLRIAPAISKARRLGREGGFIAQLTSRARLARTGVDIPVDVEIDRDALEARLIETVPLVGREPRNADISVSGDTVNVIPGQTGVELDVKGSLDAVAQALAAPTVASVELATKLQPPAIRTEDLAHLQVVLGAYTTKFHAWQKDRTHNLRMAINNLGRAVVGPGEELSFNERVGPRLSEKGWRSAPIFINGEVEPSTGGGICQVATTVYNAALLANLDITERHHHSRPVSYTPSGRDATVYWGQYDLKLKNQLTHPILILGDISETELTIRVLGHRDDDYDVEILRSGMQTLSYATKEQPDPELEEGKTEEEKPGRNGRRVTVTRVVRKNGVEIVRERLHTDTYSPQTKIVRVGAKPPETPVVLEGAAPSEQSPPGTAPGTGAKPPVNTPTEAPASPEPAGAGLRHTDLVQPGTADAP